MTIDPKHVHEALSREPGDDVTFIEIVRPLLRLAEEGLQSADRPVRFTVQGDGGRIPAAIATPAPSRWRLRVGIAVNGGAITTWRSSGRAAIRGRKVAANSRAWAQVMCIFQLPAMTALAKGLLPATC